MFLCVLGEWGVVKSGIQSINITTLGLFIILLLLLLIKLKIMISAKL